MRQLRLGIWIFALMLIQTVISKYINLNSAIGNVLFAFSIVYSIYHSDDTDAFLVGMICALISASMSTRPFWAIILMFAYSIALSRLMNTKRGKLGKTARSAVYVFLFSAVFETAIYAVINRSMDLSALLYIVLPVSVMNAVFAIIIALVYPKTVRRRSISFI